MNWRDEARQLFKLAMPVFVTQIFMALMFASDTVMAGRAGANDLAGVALALSMSMIALSMQSGFFSALTPLLSHDLGSGQLARIPQWLGQAIWLGAGWLLLSVSYHVLLAPWIMQQLGISAPVYQVAHQYLLNFAWAIPAHIVFQISRNLVEALHSTFPSIWYGATGLLVKVPLNYLCVFGYGAFPALGGAGCGLAAVFVYWAMAAVALFSAWRVMRMQHARLDRDSLRLQPALQKQLVVNGLPVAFGLLSEMLVFTVIAALIVTEGARVMSAHQVAYSLVGVFYLLPFSIGCAVAIRASRKLGEGDQDAARLVCRLGAWFGLGVASMTAASTWLFRDQLAGLFVTEPATLALAAQLLALCALYQIPDSLRDVIGGSLRAYKATGVLFKAVLVTNWLIGLPLGYLLARGLGHGGIDWVPQGYWVGLIVTLVANAALFQMGLLRAQRRSASGGLAVAVAP